MTLLSGDGWQAVYERDGESRAYPVVLWRAVEYGVYGMIAVPGHRGLMYVDQMEGFQRYEKEVSA